MEKHKNWHQIYPLCSKVLTFVSVVVESCEDMQRGRWRRMRREKGTDKTLNITFKLHSLMWSWVPAAEGIHCVVLLPSIMHVVHAFLIILYMPSLTQTIFPFTNLSKSFLCSYTHICQTVSHFLLKISSSNTIIKQQSTAFFHHHSCMQLYMLLYFICSSILFLLHHSLNQIFIQLIRIHPKS